MQIAGFQKFTMVDFPGTIAATVFTRGCSFRCPFCHNPELVISNKFNSLMNEEEIMMFFKKRADKLQGVCITGGEPTLQADLLQFIGKLKSIGYKIKLDTNGWNPETLKIIIDSDKIDYIALDIKASPDKYDQATNSKVDINNIKKSINLIMNSNIDYEFRTTVCHPIHKVEDFEKIGKLIKGAKRYFIQNFVQSKHNDEKIKFKPFTDEELKKSKKIAKKYLNDVKLR
jgi:pyruvate formate lyase activating enzyme